MTTEEIITTEPLKERAIKAGLSKSFTLKQKNNHVALYLVFLKVRLSKRRVQL